MTAYGRVFDEGQAGQLADCTIRRVDSEYISNSVAELAFGIPVARIDSSSDRGLVPWTTATLATGRFFGITVYDTTKVLGKYITPCKASVLTLGRIKVLTQIGVSIGDKAYIEEGTGLFTNVATNADDEDNLEIGVWMTDTGVITQPTIAVISINLEAVSLTRLV